MKPKKNPVTKLVVAGVKQGFKTANLFPRLGVRSAIDEKLITKKLGKDSAKKANARGLKAAQKPTNKTGSKADRAQRANLINQSNLIKNASPARANRTRGGSLAAIKAYGGQGLATAKMTPKQAARQAELTKEMNPVRKKKAK
jgi:hypothetical protein